MPTLLCFILKKAKEGLEFGFVSLNGHLTDDDVHENYDPQNHFILQDKLFIKIFSSHHSHTETELQYQI